MAKRRLTDEQLEMMAELRERVGLSYARIAKELKCSEGAVSWQCLKLGIEHPVPRRPGPKPPALTVIVRGDYVIRLFTPEEDEQLLALEAAGLTLSEIGRRLNRRWNSCRGRLMTLARREARLEACA
jgi:hypothetical protein